MYGCRHVDADMPGGTTKLNIVHNNMSYPDTYPGVPGLLPSRASTTVLNGSRWLGLCIVWYGLARRSLVSRHWRRQTIEIKYSVLIRMIMIRWISRIPVMTVLGFANLSGMRPSSLPAAHRRVSHIRNFRMFRRGGDKSLFDMKWSSSELM